MSQRRPTAARRYSLAFFSIAIAVVIRDLLAPLWGESMPFITFYPAAFISAWYGGLGPGLLATALSALASAYFLLPPTSSLRIASWANLIGLAVFVIIMLLITSLTDALRRARFKAEAAQQRVIEEGKRYYRIVETANEGIWEVDAEWRTTYVNQQLVEMLGYSANEIIGLHPLNFTFAEDREVMDEQIVAREQGFSSEIEVRLRRKDGSELWLLSHATSILGENGEFLGAFAMCTDISERKRAESERKRAESERKRAESRLRLLSDASVALASSLDFKTTLSNLTHLIVPAVADLCVIDLATESGGFERVAVLHRDPAKAELAAGLQRYGSTTNVSEGVPKVFQSGKPLLYAELTESL
jgi:PAS domain S-box-containing protein